MQAADEKPTGLPHEETSTPADVACERCQKRAVFRHDTNGQQVCKTCFLEAHVPIRSLPLIGRNAPCWCKSGKKFKRCHGGQGGRPVLPLDVRLAG